MGESLLEKVWAKPTRLESGAGYNGRQIVREASESTDNELIDAVALSIVSAAFEAQDRRKMDSDIFMEKVSERASEIYDEYIVRAVRKLKAEKKNG